MAGFWRWCVRYPAWLFAAGCVALGVQGGFDPEIGYTGGFFLGFVGYLAGFLVRRAERRDARKAALAAIAARPKLSVISGMKGQRDAEGRRRAA